MALQSGKRITLLVAEMDLELCQLQGPVLCTMDLEVSFESFCQFAAVSTYGTGVRKVFMFE